MAKRILLVDDDLINRAVFEQVLKEASFDVTIAGDGEQAFNFIMQGGFDLIILDVMLPKLDGIGVLTKLEEATTKPKNGPIALFTNLSHDPAVQEALKHGATTDLVKSELNPGTFLTKVQQLLGP